jgi:membrane-associated phospholipid phosphatase
LKRLAGDGSPEPNTQMRAAEIVSLAYFAYLAVVSVACGRARASVASLAALAVVAVAAQVFAQIETPAMAMARDVWPLLVLFAGYRLAGLFYERPDTALEARLLGVDRWLAERIAPSLRLRGAGRSVGRGRAARLVIEWLEAAYLGVYVIIPLGAVVVAYAAPAGAVDRFWAAVLASGFVCYGALPWIQTRPPRVLETADLLPAADGIRRLNLVILERGSVGVNTLPSGHAATAVATALAVATHAPAVGALFIVAALLIALATVVGRYHYAVDTILGALVAVTVWLLMRL